MRVEELLQAVLPSGEIALAGMGLLIGVIAVVLVQRAGRVWLHEHRMAQQRERIARVEARWHEAAM
jgi:hypothetical protein